MSIKEQKKTSLKKGLNTMFEQPTLSHAELDRLIQRQESLLVNQVRTRTPQLIAAACLVVVLGVLSNNHFAPRPTNPIVDDIVNEVVKNHIKRKPLEVTTQKFRDIQAFFTLIDFSPNDSKTLSKRYFQKGESLIGGRYCSIQSVTAAQLRYVDSADRLSTLYEVGYDPKVFGHMPNIDHGEEPIATTIKGLDVSLWVESNLLMVLVAPPKNTKSR